MKCKFKIKFNKLGMPFFKCESHTQIKKIFLRQGCLRELENKEIRKSSEKEHIETLKHDLQNALDIIEILIRKTGVEKKC